MKLLLRRTLVQQQFYSAVTPTGIDIALFNRIGKENNGKIMFFNGWLFRLVTQVGHAGWSLDQPVCLKK